MAAAGEATAIQNLLYQSYSENLHKAIALVMGEPGPGSDFFDLTLQFKANTSRFAAYKATQAADAIMQAADNPTQIKALLNTFNRYQAAEYQITLMRAQTARQFALFTKDTARNKILPNIKWLPSVSKNKREEHKAFYHKVFAKDDPFWNANHPGNLWGCKCDWIETNEPTEAQKGEPMPPCPKPAKGLENNPAYEGEIFSDKASYFKKQKNTALPEDETNLTALFNHKPTQWRADYYDEKGGWLFTERDRIKGGRLNDHEKAKFTKEHNMCVVLSENGYKVDFPAERTGEFDIYVNGKSADLKKTSSHNHIVDYAKKAINKQGAEFVVFEFEYMTHEIALTLLWLKKHLKYQVLYFTSKNRKVRRL
jgi:hypothetical protein